MVSQHRTRTGTWLVRTGRVAYRPVQEFLSPEETARLIFTLFRQHPREVCLVGSLLLIDPQAPDATLRSQIEQFFRGVRFRPQDRAERSV